MLPSRYWKRRAHQLVNRAKKFRASPINAHQKLVKIWTEFLSLYPQTLFPTPSQKPEKSYARLGIIANCGLRRKLTSKRLLYYLLLYNTTQIYVYAIYYLYIDTQYGTQYSSWFITRLRKSISPTRQGQASRLTYIIIGISSHNYHEHTNLKSRPEYTFSERTPDTGERFDCGINSSVTPASWLASWHGTYVCVCVCFM